MLDDDITLACPQQIDPSMDFIAYLLLTRLKGRHLHPGIRNVNVVLERPEAHGIEVVIITTTTPTKSLAARYERVRSLAAKKGVAVVHALQTEFLGRACGLDGSEGLLSMVAVTVPRDDPTARDMLCELIRRAVLAYMRYTDMVSSFLSGTRALLATAPPTPPQHEVAGWSPGVSPHQSPGASPHQSPTKTIVQPAAHTVKSPIQPAAKHRSQKKCQNKTPNKGPSDSKAKSAALTTSDGKGSGKTPNKGSGKPVKVLLVKRA